MRIGVLGLLCVLASCRSWEDARDDARALKDDVGRCEADDECEEITIEHDCTGLLGCPFPVNLKRRAEAQSRGAGIAEDSRQYRTCATAFCAAPSVAHCDVKARFCTHGSE